VKPGWGGLRESDRLRRTGQQCDGKRRSPKKSRAERWLVTGPLGFDPQRMVAVTLVFGSMVLVITLAVVLLVSFALHDRFQVSALIVALLAGCIAVALLCFRTLRTPGKAIGEGSTGALIAIGNTAAVVGFGAVAKLSPAFAVAVDAVTHLPGSGVASAAIAVSMIAAMTGSASGGQAIALPILAPIFLAQGVNPDQLHRSVAISSGVLDSLPHNGYVVTTIRAICGETHQAAYKPMAALTVVVPGIGLLVCLGLFALGL
jgi:H+/gluconate symporter-like permease